MILSIRVNNYLVYSNPIEMSLVADRRIKKFYSNIYQENNFSVVKAACVYGGNNVGKTCIVRALNTIKKVLLNFAKHITPNIFNDSKLCSFGISFLYNGQAYSYDFSYDSTVIDRRKRGFVYERLAKIEKDVYGNESEQLIFVRDMINDVYKFEGNDDLTVLLKAVSPDNILIYTINSEKFLEIQRYKEILTRFASTIEIINANNIPINKTIQTLKDSKAQKDRIVELIKLADLDIDDYKYEKGSFQNADEHIPSAPQEQVLQINVTVEDAFRLTSVHKGKPVQSLIFDSTGTKKMVSLASYIIEALETGKILVVDELDSSLHFKLTRAIVSLFNNELNTKAQIIFTAHDGTLLDCKRLFRKDQIWFAEKDEKGARIYPLKNFTAQGDGVRSDSDLLTMYKRGVVGALPEPDLISVLIGGEDNG